MDMERQDIANPMQDRALGNNSTLNEEKLRGIQAALEGLKTALEDYNGPPEQLDDVVLFKGIFHFLNGLFCGWIATDGELHGCWKRGKSSSLLLLWNGTRCSVEDWDTTITTLLLVRFCLYAELCLI